MNRAGGRRRDEPLPGLLRTLHFLGLDTVALAAVWTLGASALLHTRVGPAPLLWTLAGIWLVYTADRWLDSLPGTTEPDYGPRHRWMARHRRPMAAAWAAVAAAGLLPALLLLPPGELLVAAGLVAAGLAYLLTIQRTPSRPAHGRLRAGGGIAVALLFTAAAFLFPTLHAEPDLLPLLRAYLALALPLYLGAHTMRLWEENAPATRPFLLRTAPPCALLALLLAGLFPALTVATTAAALLLLEHSPLPAPDRIAYADASLSLAGLPLLLAGF